MIKSLIIFTEILQRPKKKNIIFEKITTPRFISIFIFIFTVTPVSTSAVKIRVVIQPHPPRISLLLILLNTTLKSNRNSCINVTAPIHFYEIFNLPSHLPNLNNLINLILNYLYLILKHRCRFVAAASLSK